MLVGPWLRAVHTVATGAPSPGAAAARAGSCAGSGRRYRRCDPDVGTSLLGACEARARAQGRGSAFHRGSRRTERPTARGTWVVTWGASRLASSRSRAEATALGVRLSIGAVYRRRPAAPQIGHGLELPAEPMGAWTSQGPHCAHSYK